jgi:hypothetical protein
MEDTLMKTDVYVRTVLTGILLCLVWICVILTPMGTPLTAQTAPPGAVVDVRIIGVRQPEMSSSLLPGGAARVLGDWDSLPTYSAPQTKAARVQ